VLKKLSIVSVLLAFSLLAAACGSDEESAPSTLKIGYAADFSDLGGFADMPASQAGEHFVALVNCAGGIDPEDGIDIDAVLATDLGNCEEVSGTTLEMTVENIAGDPEVTQRASQSLIDSGVSALLGPAFPDFGEPLLQVAAGEVPVLFVASTEPLLADASILAYLVAFDDTAQASAAAEFALDQGWSTAVTFSAPGPYFGYNPEVFTEVFTAGGGSVVADYNFVPIEDMDFSTQVNEMAAGGQAPDVVYSAMLSFQSAVLRGQLDSAGVATNYLVTDAFEATGGYFTDGVEGFYHTTHSFPSEGSRIKALADSYEATHGSPLENSSFGGLAVDAIAVVIDAFVRTNSTDPKVLGDAIGQADGVHGATGDLTYVGTSGIPDKPVYVHQVVGGAATLAATID
jgi:branched-chain amino acid transport system substrate-binding protein